MHRAPVVLLNHPVPDFHLPATGGKDISLSSLLSSCQYLVLYFYPKDCTSGCTLEGQQFRDLYAAFQKCHTEILGVSRDTLKLHEKFKAQEAFPFELLSDAEQTLCHLFDVIKEKTMYGKKVKGIERSSFVINHEGILVHAFRNVKPDGHAKEVLQFIQGHSETS